MLTPHIEQKGVFFFVFLCGDLFLENEKCDFKDFFILEFF
jgi:hypothetical protein